MSVVDGDAMEVADQLPSERSMMRDLIESLVDSEAQIGAIRARQAMLFTAVTEIIDLQTSRLPDAARKNREMPLREALAEIAAALRVTERTVQRRMSDGTTLLTRFTRTCAALADGRISPAHAAVILEAGSEIDDDEARTAFELSALDVAEIETAGRLRSVARTIAEQAQPVGIAERHRQARKARGVFARDLPDPMAELTTVQPAVIVHGILDRLTRMAHEDKRTTADADAVADADADDRTMDQRRADTLADLLLCAAPAAHGEGLGAITAHVQVTVPVLTLAGVDEKGATLAGYGPIDPDTARCLAKGAPGWDRVMTHPVTGAVLAVDRYRPTADQLRTLRVRDEHCRFPGCRQTARRCEADHTHDAALGGHTHIDNLAHLCKRHHTLKHATDWQVRQLGGGTLEWTSPTGLVYVDVPAPTLRFMPSGEPPPF
ncbi:MAG: DUF222 domain-containing protein [Microbacterium sp.]